MHLSPGMLLCWSDFQSPNNYDKHNIRRRHVCVPVESLPGSRLGMESQKADKQDEKLPKEK